MRIFSNKLCQYIVSQLKLIKIINYLHLFYTKLINPSLKCKHKKLFVIKLCIVSRLKLKNNLMCYLFYLLQIIK